MTRRLQGVGISKKFFLVLIGLLMVCQHIVEKEDIKENAT